MKRFRLGVRIGGFWKVALVAQDVDAFGEGKARAFTSWFGLYDGKQISRGVTVFMEFEPKVA